MDYGQWLGTAAGKPCLITEDAAGKGSLAGYAGYNRHTKIPVVTLMSNAILPNHVASGAGYLLRGARLLTEPKLALFVLVPLLINLALFVVATSILLQQFEPVLSGLLDFLPGWIDFLAWLLWGVLVIGIFLIYGYSFSLLTNLIAAPFYGILAEKVELHLTGQAPEGVPLRQMIPRTLIRELQKLWYFISRGIMLAILSLALSFIPLVNLLVPLLGLLWGAWSMAIQYADYPADNNGLAFAPLRKRLGQQGYSTCGFGGLVLLGTMIPVLNILVMPAAVVGGTLFWLQELKQSPADA